MKATLLLSCFLLLYQISNSQVFRSYTFGDASLQIQQNFNLNTDVNSATVFIYGNNKFVINQINPDGSEIIKHTYYTYSDSLFNTWLPPIGNSKFYPHRAFFEPIDSSYYVGGIVKANYSPYFGDYNTLIKFSRTGDTIWVLHAGPLNNNFDFINLNDSSFIFFNGGIVSINKYTKNCNWFGAWSTPNSLAVTPLVGLKKNDSTFYYCGFYIPINDTSAAMFGLADRSGNALWTKLYKVNSPLGFEFIKVCSDYSHRFYLLTQVQDTNASHIYVNVTCLDDTGQVQWSKYYYVPNYLLTPVDIIEKTNGGCLVVCNYRMAQQQAICPVTINLDSNGTVINAYKQYPMIPGTDGIAYSIKQASEFKYAIDGTKLLIVDTSGWSCDATGIAISDSANIFSVSNISFQFDSLPFNANSVNVFYEINNAADSVLVDSCIYYTSINEEDQPNYVSVFPQPASSDFTIICSKLFNGIALVNLTGQKVLEQQWHNAETSKQVNVNSLLPGIYFYEINFNGNRFANGMVVKME